MTTNAEELREAVARANAKAMVAAAKSAQWKEMWMAAMDEAEKALAEKFGSSRYSNEG